MDQESFLALIFPELELRCLDISKTWMERNKNGRDKGENKRQRPGGRTSHTGFTPRVLLEEYS